ncbi:MAG TPA: hypothetical protein VMZ53_32550 [Kofleriaceae bacterium]|nr:hypothetical protein [Kofleriaceae bacterium]
MKNAVLAFVALILLATPALAEPLPDAPPPEESQFGKRVLEKVTDATNGFFAHHVDRLSHEMVVIRVDPEQQQANVDVHAGLLGFGVRVASNVTVVDGTARVKPRLALAVAGKSLDLRLPTIDVAATEFRGERGVEVRLPVLRRTF